jgi:hypothetical protein
MTQAKQFLQTVRLLAYDERPLSGIGIQWQLFGDESEERTVNTRPLFDSRDSRKRPVGQSEVQKIGELQTSRWRPHPTGQQETLANVEN